MTEPPDRIDAIVDAALGCGIRGCEQATGGRMAETYLLDLDGGPGRAVCKVGGPSVRTGDVVEPLVLRRVAATTDLPCPAVLATGTVRADDGRDRWALYEFRDGDTPTPFDELRASVRRRIVRETGAMLGGLHDANQFDRTAGLGADGTELRLSTPAGVHFPERGRRLAARLPGVDDGDWQPVLTHGDLFPGNLLVDDDGAVTAFLDWGNAHVTTAGYALARAEMRFVDWFRFPAAERATLRAALRDGYRQHRPLPADYHTLGTAYKLLWLVQSGERLFRHTLSARGRTQLLDHARSLLP